MEKHADDFMPFVDTEDGIMDSGYYLFFYEFFYFFL